MEKRQPGILSFVVLKNPGLPLVIVTYHDNDPCFHSICHYVDAKIFLYIVAYFISDKISKV